MKSDFRKFRLYCRLGIVFMVLAMVAFVCCNIFIGGTLSAAIAVTLLIVVGAVAAVFEWWPTTIFFVLNVDNALQYRTAIRLTRRTARAIAPSRKVNQSFASTAVHESKRNELNEQPVKLLVGISNEQPITMKCID